MQSMLLGSSVRGDVVGVSPVVYGLLVTCMIWAPRNELNYHVIGAFIFGQLIAEKSIYYTTVAIIYVGLQILGLLFAGTFGDSIVVSELFHVSGAAWGAVFAGLMLKFDLVDCEGWDLFTLWHQRQNLARAKESLTESIRPEPKERRDAVRQVDDDEPNPDIRGEPAVHKVLGLIELGNLDAALLVYEKSSRALPHWPEQPDLYAIIKALHARGAFVELDKTDARSLSPFFGSVGQDEVEACPGSD